ncbi:MAG: carbohydrate kinase family protein [Patescibacteria group bacterium]
MYDLITVGDAVVDTHVNIDNASVECDVDTRACRLCLDYASKIPITGSFQSLGGNAANVACGATKLGMNSAIVTSIGADSNGRIILEELKKSKVDTSLVYRDKQTQTRYSVVLNFRAERTILSYHEKRNYKLPKKMPATEWIYYTSMSGGFENLQNALLQYLDDHPSVKLAYNPGSFQLKSAMNEVKEILPRADLLIVNLQEAELIADTTLKKEKTITSLVHKLLSLGAKEVVITDAEHGAIAGNTDEIWSMDTYKIEVVSKTGAGDAFSAAYLAARNYEHDIRLALTWGAAMSAAVIAEHGPQKGLIGQKALQKMIDRFPNIKPKKIF